MAKFGLNGSRPYCCFQPLGMPSPTALKFGLRLVVVAATVPLLPQEAFAHITQGPLGGFAGGFAHPLTGLDHFLAMFAVGVWGAQMGGRSVWALRSPSRWS